MTSNGTRYDLAQRRARSARRCASSYLVPFDAPTSPGAPLKPDPHTRRAPSPVRHPALVLSCEHAGNSVPRAFRSRFQPPPRVLASHRGHDPGTEELGRILAAATGAPLFVNRVTRLLVDANRSADHPELLSRWAQALPADLRARAVDEVWTPHRAAVSAAVHSAAPTVHIGVHSFTPRLRGVTRDVDVGFLYDPRRAFEARVVAAWQRRLAAREPRLRLARNRPYRGTDDGLTTALRAELPDASYAGIELEVSQRFPRASGARARWLRLAAHLAETLAEVLAGSRAERAQ